MYIEILIKSYCCISMNLFTIIIVFNGQICVVNVRLLKFHALYKLNHQLKCILASMVFHLVKQLQRFPILLKLTTLGFENLEAIPNVIFPQAVAPVIEKVQGGHNVFLYGGLQMTMCCCQYYEALKTNKNCMIQSMGFFHEIGNTSKSQVGLTHFHLNNEFLNLQNKNSLEEEIL